LRRLVANAVREGKRGVAGGAEMAFAKEKGGDRAAPALSITR